MRGLVWGVGRESQGLGRGMGGWVGAGLSRRSGACVVGKGWLRAVSGHGVASEVFGLSVGHGLETRASGVDLGLVICVGH